MLLTPVGIVNERHEPPSFNGVERPFVETVIIPTTWRELGFGVTGDLGRGFRYRAYLTSSLDASLFRCRGGDRAKDADAGFDASLRNPAKVARLEYRGRATADARRERVFGHDRLQTPAVNPRVGICPSSTAVTAAAASISAVFSRTRGYQPARRS